MDIFPTVDLSSEPRQGRACIYVPGRYYSRLASEEHVGSTRRGEATYCDNEHENVHWYCKIGSSGGGTASLVEDPRVGYQDGLHVISGKLSELDHMYSPEVLVE